MRKGTLKAGLAAIALMTFAPAANAADNGVQVGTLECHVDGGWGAVIASSRDMPRISRRRPNSSGELSRYGIDIGYTSDASDLGRCAKLWLAPAHSKVISGVRTRPSA
jgi:hypothetical protein